MKKMKGNYKLKNDQDVKAPAKPGESITEQFEKRALEKLGGSTAFVQKKNTFVWEGEQGEKRRN
jgi:hypothetical protein